MNNNNTREIVERFKAAQEFIQDYAFYCKCYDMIQNYVGKDAISLLIALAKRYECEINQLIFLFGGRYVIHGVDFDTIQDIQIIDQLAYIGQRIPACAFTREGEKYVAEKLLKYIGWSEFIF